jgi:hypothetical protein
MRAQVEDEEERMLVPLLKDVAPIAIVRGMGTRECVLGWIGIIR